MSDFIAESPSFAHFEYADIASLYVAYFGRAGDPGGMNYWLDALAHGASLQSIAASFSVQPEAQAQYPFLADPVHASSAEVQDFISQIYQNLFGRTPEAGGLAYWQNSLEANLGNPQAIGTFILAVADGAQGSDQTTLANKIFAAEFFTSTLSSHNVAFDAAASALAHSDLPGVTADLATLSNAESTVMKFVDPNSPGLNGAVALPLFTIAPADLVGVNPTVHLHSDLLEARQRQACRVCCA
jgi:hypothetical protein